jgi:hypothetical protein
MEITEKVSTVCVVKLWTVLISMCQLKSLILKSASEFFPKFALFF